jgi:poly(beta-D-mannuronate) lyase
MLMAHRLDWLSVMLFRLLFPARRFILVFFAFGLTANSLPAREIPVKEPADLKKALKQLQPGDELILRDGVWTNCQIKFEGSGTAERPIILRAQTPGRVLLSGNSWVKLGGDHLLVSGLLFKNGACPRESVIAFRTSATRTARNSRVTDCAVVNYNPPTSDGKCYWVSLYGSSNRVDHCRFEGKNDGGPTLTVWLEKNGQPNYHLIDHNYFLHRPRLGRNGGETMRIGDSATSFEVSRTIVEFNLFEHCSGEAEYISNKSCENIYRFNTILESKGALVLRHGNRNTVEGNWFFGHHVPGTGGVRIIGEDQRVLNNYFDGLAGHDFESTLPFVDGIPHTPLNGYFQIKRAVVAFNTLVDCDHNITFGVGAGLRKRSQPSLNCVIANNLVFGTNAPLVRVQDEPVNIRWLGNILYGAEIGLPKTSGVATIDPKLIRVAEGIARPARGSPAIGAAEGNFPEVTEDIEGRSRTGKRDIGCIQSSDQPARRKPLSAKEVGPSWSNSQTPRK